MISFMLQRCFASSSIRIYRSSLIIIPNFHLTSCSHLLKTAFPVSFQVRTFWETFPSTRPLFYEKDGMDRTKYDLIYRSRMFNYTFYAQFMSLLCFGSQLCAASYYCIRSYISQEIVVPATYYEPFYFNYDLVTVFIVGLFTVQSAIMFIAAQNVLLRAYYDEETETYVLVSLGKNPFVSQRTFCKPGELIPLKESYLNFMFGNHETSKGKRFYLRYDTFKSIEYYNELTGYRFY